MSRFLIASAVLSLMAPLALAQSLDEASASNNPGRWELTRGAAISSGIKTIPGDPCRGAFARSIVATIPPTPVFGGSFAAVEFVATCGD